MKALRIGMYATVAVAIIAAAVLLYLDWDWAAAAAWALVAGWAGYSAWLDRDAERWAAAYVTMAGRHVSAYVRGYSDGANGTPFHAGKD